MASQIETAAGEIGDQARRLDAALTAVEAAVVSPADPGYDPDAATAGLAGPIRALGAAAKEA
jgi:hypothetical protein